MKHLGWLLLGVLLLGAGCTTAPPAPPSVPTPTIIAVRPTLPAPTPTNASTPTAPSPTPPPTALTSLTADCPAPPADYHLARNDTPTRIRAATIGLDAPVVIMGWESYTDPSGNPASRWVVPDCAAGWHQNSALPGQGGNIVLSGHHNIAGEVFREVVSLEVGDEVELYLGETVTRYVVAESLLLREADEPMSVRLANAHYIEATDDERLTLSTSWPYETNTHRVIVIARPAE